MTNHCGDYPAAEHRTPYCPVCAALQDVPQDDDDAYRRGVNLVFDRCERVSRLHQQYRQRRR